jgi:predicted ArsR family transcriptional regulator
MLKFKKNVEKWKQKQIDRIILLKNDLEKNNVNKDIIDNFIKENYQKINQKYKNKLENIKPSLLKKEIDSSIENIISNKNYMIELGYDEERINNYTNRHYQYILNEKNIDKLIDFID